MEIRPIDLRKTVDEKIKYAIGENGVENIADPTDLALTIDIALFSEHHYRGAFVKGMIYSMGLGEYEEDILSGCGRSVNLPTSPTHDMCPLRQIELVRANSNAILEFTVDYINRWEMYDKLFPVDQFGE
jgi:hypothetical protein